MDKPNFLSNNLVMTSDQAFPHTNIQK